MIVAYSYQGSSEKKNPHGEKDLFWTPFLGIVIVTLNRQIGVATLAVLNAHAQAILCHNARCNVNMGQRGSTFYIGIAMVVLPYFGPWENRNLSFRFQFPLNFISTNTKVEHMLKANDIWKKNQE